MATGPIETHLHRSFNWENGAPGPQEGPRGRSAKCGNGLFAQCVRLRSEINQRARRRGRLGYQERSRLLDLMEERLPREEWRAMGFGDGRERHPLWSKWLVNEKVDESFNEESRQNEGRQDQTKGPGQQRCHAPCQLLLQPLARHARISFARFYTVEPHHAAETDRRP